MWSSDFNLSFSRDSVLKFEITLQKFRQIVVTFFARHLNILTKHFHVKLIKLSINFLPEDWLK